MLREIKCSVGWIGGPLEVQTHPLPPPGLACVSGFEFWVLRFRD